MITYYIESIVEFYEHVYFEPFSSIKEERLSLFLLSMSHCPCSYQVNMPLNNTFLTLFLHTIDQFVILDYSLDEPILFSL